MKRQKYVIVGTGGRSRMFYEAMLTTHKDTADLLAICDLSQTRMDYTNRRIEEISGKKLPTYLHTDFDKMLDEQKPDVVFVSTIDRTHHDYIIRSMRKGYNVMTEKPMTIDAEKVEEILDVQKETGKELRVTFNYRYAPSHTRIRELIMDGTIGEVHSIHFEWLLNTNHGADYYRRWHRNKLNSGGLLVHKSTHHFDLVNFWLGSDPVMVAAMGELNFYGRHNAERRGVTKFYDRSHGHVTPQEDPFAIDMENNPTLKGLYLDAEEDSGYIRDRSVFADDISIEDTMGVLVKYKNNAILTYSLNSYLPWEGYQIAFNGSKGRIEYKAVEKTYINAGGDMEDEGRMLERMIKIFPLWDEPYEVEFEIKEGGHGGGDPLLLQDLFGEPLNMRVKHKATHIDGAKSVLIGVAANKSIASNQFVKINDLVNLKNYK